MALTKTKVANLLKLCKRLSKKSVKGQNVFIDGANQKTMHLISEIYHNMQYYTASAPTALRKKLICCMKKNATGCLYISNKHARNKTKKKYLKSQSGDGLFTLIISAVIPILTSIINAFTK